MTKNLSPLNYCNQKPSLTIDLTHKPEHEMKGPVTIYIDTKSDLDIVEAKWSAGKHDVDHFDYAGNEISIDAMSFDVVTNGWYTVYVKNADGEAIVQMYKITNIIPEDDDDINGPGKPGDPPSGTLKIQVNQVHQETMKMLLMEMTHRMKRRMAHLIKVTVISYQKQLHHPLTTS